MFPDFPKAKAQARKLLLRHLAQHANSSPLLRGIKRFRQHEGDAGELIRDDASRSAIDFKSMSSDFSLDRSEMKAFNWESMRDKLLGVAKEFSASQEKHLLEEVSSAAAEVGNTIDAGGQAFGQEHFLEMIRKMRIEFNPHSGEPIFPTLVVHPDALPKLKEAAVKWEKDPIFNAEHERLLAQKREEWNARESNRKLVD